MALFGTKLAPRILSAVIVSRRKVANMFSSAPEIRLRAVAQIGKISRELGKAQAVHTKEHGSEIRLASSGKSKEKQLADAGLYYPHGELRGKQHRSRRRLASKPSCGCVCQVIDLGA
jgi:hypothetical protein